jgi:hypothetical protein
MGALSFAKLAALAYGAVLAVGLTVVLVRSPHPITPGYEVTEGCSPDDLAHYCRGVRARVSSYDVFANHHPIFAIDGRGSHEPLEKWASSRGDAEPWIELLFPAPVDFSAVRLLQAGEFEPAEYNMRSYRLTCSAGDELVAELAVEGNEASAPMHALSCRAVDRLLIRYDIEPGTGRDVARLYEIEVRP